MDVFTLSAKLILNTADFNTSLQNSEKKMSTWGVTLGNLASQAITKGVRAITDFGKSTIETGADFEAMMSEVKALRQDATAEEFDKLSQKAQELGASTKFTATEVASAFKYMALAGWDTDEMLAGIDGVLSLSAASGENLAQTSDIVTDALTALGLTADDTNHFVDVLAAAAANSNTTVGMMGEAFKYLATTGGVLGYSIDDVATVLGLLANNGIKASQAGTSMRQILNSLVAPSDEAAKAMSDLGISLFEEGTDKAKPLLQVLQEMRSVFQNSNFDLGGKSMDEVQSQLAEVDAWYDEWKKKLEEGGGAADYLGKQIDSKELEKMYNEKLQEVTNFNEQFLGQLSSIGGLRGISSLLAIMKSTDDDFNQLVTSVENSNGAAQSMAGTMLDNLKGDITILNSAIDGLKILVSEDFNSSFRSFVQTLTGGVGEISKSFKESGLVGLITTFAEKLIGGIADWLVNNPEKVTKVIESLIKIITDTAPKLAEAFIAVLKNPDLWVALGDMFKDIWNIITGKPTTADIDRANKSAEYKAKSGEELYSELKDVYDAGGDVGKYMREKYGELAEKYVDSVLNAFSVETTGKTKSGKTLANPEGMITSAKASLSNLITDYEKTSDNINSKANNVADAFDNVNSAAQNAAEAMNSIPSYSPDGSHAKGAWNIPYDNYYARLHRGEMVLTSSQARRYRDGDGGSMNLSALTSAVVNAVREGMAGAVVRSYLNGKDVTDDVARRMGNAMKSQRYAT